MYNAAERFLLATARPQAPFFPPVLHTLVHGLQDCERKQVLPAHPVSQGTKQVNQLLPPIQLGACHNLNAIGFGLAFSRICFCASFS